jgi:thioredoxin-like negative regulator of GroEL
MLELSGKTSKEQADRFVDFMRRHPVALVVYGATWCGPCRAFDVSIRRVEKLGLVPVLHVDVDACGELCEDVQSVPTSRLFSSGVQVAELAGAVGADELIQWIKTHSPKEGADA